MEGIFDQIRRFLLLRLFLTSLMVIIPAGVSIGWVGTIYHNLMWGTDIPRMFLSMILSSIPAILAAGFVLIYPLERWVIRDQATRSLKWVAGRILAYTIIAIPLAIAFLWGMRLGVGQYSTLFESSYFVITVTNVILYGFVYSFVERMLGVVEQRETRLKQEIQQLRIEIDETKRRRQVQEITETDYFRNLQLKARQLRASRAS